MPPTGGAGVDRRLDEDWARAVVSQAKRRHRGGDASPVFANRGGERGPLRLRTMARDCAGRSEKTPTMT